MDKNRYAMVMVYGYGMLDPHINKKIKNKRLFQEGFSKNIRNGTLFDRFQQIKMENI